MKLSDWARANGVHPKTAYRWWRNGTLPVPARQINARVILVDDAASTNRAAPELSAVGLYARVSSHDQRSDLDRQIARLSEWAAKAGARVLRIEVGDERGTGEAPPSAGGPGGTHRGGRAQRPPRPDERRAGGGSTVGKRAQPGRARSRREGRRPGPGHDRGADLVLRPAVRTALTPQPGRDGASVLRITEREHERLRTGSTKSVVNRRSTMGSCCRSNWYIRCSTRRLDPPSVAVASHCM